MARVEADHGTGRSDGRPDLDRDLRVLERAENFPVALRLLPADRRTHLRAVYDVARTVDDLSDTDTVDTTADLLAFRADLARIWADGPPPQAPVLRWLRETVTACGLAPEPFQALVEAGLLDQRVSRYPTFEDLRGYCALSADPVGHLVLDVFGVRDPRARPLSDLVCTALQLLEHWQDVAEDHRAGRIYLPGADMADFEVPPAHLAAPHASPQLRALLEFQTHRALVMLEQGSRLVGLLRGWARIAVAGYVAGGVATGRALRRAGYDCLPGPPRPQKRDVLAAAGRIVVAGSARIDREGR